MDKMLGLSRKRSDTNCLVAEAATRDHNSQRKRAKPRTPLPRRMAYGVGHTLNDFSTSLMGSYMITFQTKILGLSNQSAGIICMAAAAFDAAFALVVGYACDNLSIPYLSAMYGRRKLWNLIGTVLVAGLLPFLFMPCFACGPGSSEWTLVAYYLALTILVFAGYSAGQVSHIALIPEIAKRPGEMVELNALRSVVGSLSGMFMYGGTWVLLGTDDSHEELSHDQWVDFMKLCVIAIGVGSLFSLIFHVGTVEPKPQQRQENPVFQGRERARSRARSFRALSGKAIDGICLEYTEDDFRSDKTSPSYSNSELDPIEEDLSIDNPAFHLDCNDRQATVVIGNESPSQMVPNPAETSVSVQVEICDDPVETKDRSVSVRSIRFQAEEDLDIGNFALHGVKRDRSVSVRSVQTQFEADTRSCRTDSSGFEDGDDSTKDVDSIASMDGLGYECAEVPRKEKDSSCEGVERASDADLKKNTPHNVLAIIIEDVDYQEKLEAAKRKATDAVSWKDWFKKPLFYKVSFAFMCMRLGMTISRVYLPLYLTDTLHFNKEAIAYFPLVVLVSGVLSSAVTKKLDKILGIRWTYSLAAIMVAGSCVWFYMLDESSKGEAYCAAVLSGFGASMMFVTSMALAAELVGENKGSGAFVYAAMAILAKVSVGLTVGVVQEFYPGGSSSGDYIRHIFSMVPGVASVVGLMAVLAFFPATMACRKVVHTVDADTQTDDLDACYDNPGLTVLVEKKMPDAHHLRAHDALPRVVE